MRVRELLNALNELDPSMEVLAHTADSRGLQFYAIEIVSVARARRWRDASGEPRTHLDDDQGRPLALLTLSTDY